MHVGGRINADWIWWGEPTRLTVAQPNGLGILEDGVSFRRARLVTDGSLWEVFEWMAEFEFASSTDITFEDFWFGVTQLPILGTFRVGHIKVPQGLESYTSSRFLTFMERAAPFDAFLEEYDPGFVFLNTAFDQRMTWAIAYHRIDRERHDRLRHGGPRGNGTHIGIAPVGQRRPHLAAHWRFGAIPQR